MGVYRGGAGVGRCKGIGREVRVQCATVEELVLDSRIEEHPTRIKQLGINIDFLSPKYQF